MNNNTESETTYDYIVKNIFNEINTLQTLQYLSEARVTIQDALTT